VTRITDESPPIVTASADRTSVTRFFNMRPMTAIAVAFALIAVLTVGIVGRGSEPAEAQSPIPSDAAPGDVSTIAGGFSAPEIQSVTGTLQVGDTLYIAQWNGTILTRNLVTGAQAHFAGIEGSGLGPDGNPAKTTELGSPSLMAADADGNLYVATNSWPNDCTVRRIDADAPHIVTTIAGTPGACGWNGPGPAAGEALDSLQGLVVDSTGTRLYAVSSGSAVIRINLIDDTTEVVAGWGVTSPDDAPTAADAQFTSISSIGIDEADNLYVLDHTANAIYRIESDFSSVSTVLGDAVNSGLGRGFADGALATAQMDLQPWSDGVHESAVLAVTADGSAIYFFDSGNQVLRRIDLVGQTVETIAGQIGVRGTSGDGGPATSAELDGVRAFNVVGDAFYFPTSGYLTDSWQNNLRRIDLTTGVIENAKPLTYVGDGGLAVDATLNQPVDLVRVGNDLFVAEQFGHRIRKVDLTTGVITTYAGTGLPGTSLTPEVAATAPLGAPNALAWDGSGLLVVGMDTLVRRIDAETGIISLVAGTGVPGYLDGPVETAQFSMQVTGITVDGAGRIFVADTQNAVIRCIGCEAPGIVSTVAGLPADHPDFKTPQQCDSDGDLTIQDMDNCPPAPDGPALETFLSMPARVTTDPNGHVIFSEMTSGVVRRLNDDGTLTTIAGVLGDLSRNGGDGTLATSASIAGPTGLRYDAAGNLYIGEVGGSLLDLVNNNVGALMAFQPGVTRVLPNGTIERFAGNGLRPPMQPDDGPRTSATFLFPTAFAQDAGTHLYVADILNNRIRRIEGTKPNLTASASGGPYVAGRSGVVRAKVVNTGSGYATGPIRTTVTLPTGLRFVGVRSSAMQSNTLGWQCDPHGSVVTCELAENLAPNAQVVLELDVIADGTVTGKVTVEVQTTSDSDDDDLAGKVYVLNTQISAPSAEVAAANGGYTLFGADGGVFAFGSDRWPGAWRSSDVVDGDNCGATALALRSNGAILWNHDEVNAALVGMLSGEAVGVNALKDCSIYRVAAADGGVFTFGAEYHGSLGGVRLNAPIVGISGRESGYRLVGADGGVFSFGDHKFFGSMGGTPLNQPVVDIVDTPHGDGYWLVAADGGVFSFGNAEFFGSTAGLRLNAPVVDLVPTESGHGYWLVAADGGVFSFGDAVMHGSLGGHHLHRPIVAAS